mmetsp:Transcript_39/g.63  ORF Transcript_39/g.63 Transcript_39/m.63 type:complete len:758 (-) Transcript_39:1376-3649(-)
MGPPPPPPKQGSFIQRRLSSKKKVQSTGVKGNRWANSKLIKSASKRFSNSRKKNKTESENPLFAIESIQENVAYRGYFKTKKKQKWIRYWYVLHSQHLTAFKERPQNAGDAMSLLVETIAIADLKEVRIENLAIVLKLKDDNDGKSNMKMDALARQKSRAQQFLRKSHNQRVLMAESQDEARELIHALNDSALKEEEERMAATKALAQETESAKALLEVTPKREKAKKKKYFLSKLIVRSTVENTVIFEGKNVESTIVKADPTGTHSGHVHVKQMLGSLPSSGFNIEVEICERNGYVVGNGVSKDFVTRDIVANDESKNVFDDSINVNFMVEDEYRIFLELERENLSLTPKDTMAQVEAVVLRGLLENDISLVLLGLFFTFLVFFMVFTWSLRLSAVVSIMLVGGIFASEVLEQIKHSLLEKLQPYFIASMLIKSKSELNRPDDFRKDTSITDEEYELIDLFREECQDFFDDLETDSMAYEICAKYINTDYRLVRFLRARNYNFVKAKKMLESSLAFRFEMVPLDLVNQDVVPQWMLDYLAAPQLIEMIQDRSMDRLPWYFRDRNKGNLAVLLVSGPINWRKVFKKMNNDTELIFSYLIWTLELVMEDMDRAHEESNGEVPSYISIVADLQGLQLTQQIPFFQLVKLLLKFIPKVLIAYPELLQRVQIINAPRFFYTLWETIYPTLPANVRDKIHLSSKGSQQKVLGYIEQCLDRSEIPASYGGDLIIDGDETCRYRIPSNGPFLPDKGKSLLERTK